MSEIEIFITIVLISLVAWLAASHWFKIVLWKALSLAGIQGLISFLVTSIGLDSIWLIWAIQFLAIFIVAKLLGVEILVVIKTMVLAVILGGFTVFIFFAVTGVHPLT